MTIDNSKRPAPLENELPTAYADRVGEWYSAATSDDHKSEHGQYLTPPAIANFMGSLASPPVERAAVCILDPGAGSGVLSCALCEALAGSDMAPARIDLDVYEVEGGLLKHLQEVLEYLKAWLHKRRIALVYTIHAIDFVLENASGITEGQKELSLAANQHPLTKFDYIISNPPYFKVQKDDPRAKACKSVVHGQPNIYGLFMAVSAYLLKPGGEMIYITPRSFAAGPYFRLFREKFFDVVRPLQVHLFGSRTDAFDRSEVLQENVILHAVRDDQWSRKPNLDALRVQVSFSAGARDIASHSTRNVPVGDIIDMTTQNLLMHIPTSDEEQTIIHLVNSWKGTLHSYGLEISTGPVVPFRATEFITNDASPEGAETVPLLWMQNVKPMATTWPVPTRKQQYIISSQESEYLLLPNKNYVLLRRFSPKEDERRITASPYIADRYPQFWLVGLENHLNYIYRKRGDQLTEAETYGICVLLGCRLIDTYFRSYNGNTQVSATELRSMPLPPMETVRAIGAEAAKGKLTNGELDAWITAMLVKSNEIISEVVGGEVTGSTGDSTGTRAA